MATFRTEKVGPKKRHDFGTVNETKNRITIWAWGGYGVCLLRSLTSADHNSFTDHLDNVGGEVVVFFLDVVEKMTNGLPCKLFYGIT